MWSFLQLGVTCFLVVLRYRLLVFFIGVLVLAPIPMFLYVSERV